MKRKTQAKLLGRFIVTDPEVCHGHHTFCGTDIEAIPSATKRTSTRQK
jgi:uncharacterized protein (DUF433 family)